jgi:hypothetical protein
LSDTKLTPKTGITSVAFSVLRERGQFKNNSLRPALSKIITGKGNKSKQLPKATVRGRRDLKINPIKLRLKPRTTMVPELCLMKKKRGRRVYIYICICT